MQIIKIAYAWLEKVEENGQKVRFNFQNANQSKITYQVCSRGSVTGKFN